MEIYTDGACSGNPGPGGWGFVITERGRSVLAAGNATGAGYEEETTNNRMEVVAAIEALKSIPEGTKATLYSDSIYLVNSMRPQKRWRRKKNLDLWKELDELAESRSITWKWVRGHNGNAGNELADRLATDVLMANCSEEWRNYRLGL